MKVLTCSRTFPAGHPRKGQPTHFVEKIEACLADTIPGWQMKSDFVLHDWYPYYNCTMPKGHTIRAGSRFSPGDMISLRVWQLPGGMYTKGNKQIEFAQVEVKKTWPIEINNRFGAASFEVVINGKIYGQLHYGNDKDINREGLITLAKNDGLELEDFVSWFNIHPKKKGDVFQGQVICWNYNINY